MVFFHISYNELDNKSLTHSYQIKSDAQRNELNERKNEEKKMTDQIEHTKIQMLKPMKRP